MVRKKNFIGKKLKYHKKKYPEALKKRREELRKERMKKNQTKETQEKLQEMRQLYENECKRRKKAESVANGYYLEWKAERQAKDQALASQSYTKPTSLPNSLYLSSSLLKLQLNERNEENILGSGVFGTVKICEFKGTSVAAKCLKQGDESIATVKRLVKEEVLLNLKSHKSIPTLVGVCLDEQPFKLVLQLYQIDQKSITLSKLCSNSFDFIHLESDWLSIINKLAQAIDHVHGCGYLHNDIKTDNVVIYDSSSEFVPVLIDFGKSCRRENGCTKSMSAIEQASYRKKYRHIAPEIVDGSHKQSIYSDIYSFGYLVYCIYTLSCKDSDKLRKVVKKSYKVKTWDSRASLAALSQILA